MSPNNPFCCVSLREKKKLFSLLFFVEVVCGLGDRYFFFFFLRYDDFDNFDNFVLPKDEPPLDLLGAPVVGPCLRTLHLHPERTGMGVNCNTFLVLEYFTDVLSYFFGIVEQLKCFLILQCLSSANFDDRRICSFHFVCLN